MIYRPEIDGLRAVAVGIVILFHAGFEQFSGGYVGVDVFFVISGYLITSILLEDLRQDRFSIPKFYERRARRILPALFFVMACCVPFAWMWMYPSQLLDFGKALLTVVFFVSNVLFWKQANYFAPDVYENPLLHTWSLAVEEQFYIFFPIVLLLLWRLRPRLVMPALLVMALVSLVGSELGARIAPGANFFLIPSRAWELLAGSLCALAPLPAHRRVNDVLAIGGLAAIIVSVVLFDDETPFPSLYALLPVGGTVLLVLFAGPATWVGRALSLRIMVGLGLISYSAYLWHQPLFAFARIRSSEPPDLLLIWVLIAATFALAWLSWRFIEQPFRAGPKSILTQRKSVFWTSGVGISAFALIGLVSVMGNGLPQRTAPSGVSFAALDIDGRLRSNQGIADNCARGFAVLDECSTNGPPEILLWGDSFAMHLGPALMVSPTQAEIAQLTKPVCAPIIDIAIVNVKYTESWARSCVAFNDRVMAWIEDTPSLKAVVMSSPMGILNARVYQRGGSVAPIGSRALVAQSMQKTAQRIRAAGAVPVFVVPPPRTGENLSSCAVSNLVFAKGKVANCGFPRTDLSETSRQVRDFLSTQVADMEILSLDDMFCDAARCQTSHGDTLMFIDKGHISREGARLLGLQHDLAGQALSRMP